MTATLEPTKTVASRPDSGRRRREPLPPERPLPLLAISEVALAAVTVVAVISLSRVFAGTDWVLELVAQAGVAFGLMAVTRRRGIRLSLSTLATLAAGTIMLAYLYARETTFGGLPTLSTAGALGDDIREAFTGFSEISAPVEAVDGFMIVVAAAVWLSAVIGDWWAFRVGASLEATFPPTTLFLVVSVLGDGSAQITSAAAYAGAILLFLLVRRADRLGQVAVWVGRHREAGPRSLLMLGTAIAVVAIIASAVATPLMPGAQSDGVVNLTEIADPGEDSRVTVSPLVDIRDRLIEQSDLEVFTVRSSQPGYWRLTSLNQFDGRVWSTKSSYGKADGDLDDGVAVASDRVTITQEFNITALNQIWLPAAYEPQSLEAAVPARYDETSGTIIVNNDLENSNEARYNVTSATPVFDPAQLAAASTQIPSEIADVYLELPDNFPEPVVDLANEVTSDAGSTYEKAMALQTFFREEFTYDLNVPSGDSNDVIQRFLFETRAGYCQQFAGSYAAMARALGIPARVAVGFTPGDPVPGEPNLYSVKGRYAHAWPEVYLGEYGWVSFEPTPNRGAPFAEQHTGVPPQQASATGGGTGVAPLPPVTTTTAPDGAPTTTRPVNPGLDDTTVAGGGSSEDTDRSNPWIGRMVWVLVGLVVIAGLYIGAVAGFDVARRHRRRSSASSTEAKVGVAWDEAQSAVRSVGVRASAGETQDEFARRAGARLPDAAPALGGLADHVRNVTFAPYEPDETVGDNALALADDVRARVLRTLSVSERVTTRFDPRRVADRVLNQ